MMPKIAVVYLSYHSDEYLDDMIQAFQGLAYPKDRLSLVIVDNPHPQFGSSVGKIREKVLTALGLPETVLLPQDKNLGFSGGNNVGIKWALENGFDYIFLHNQDGYFAPDCLSKMAEALEKDETIGCAQALILLEKEKDKVNSAGNSFSYLGFGFIDNFGKKPADLNLPEVKEVGYASGAGLMLRSSVVKKYGMLDEDLFAYHEDVEYSLRLKMAGKKVALVSTAVFFHKYEFNRSSYKFYLMERNRYAVLLMYYAWPTLFLLFPILFFMEFGLIFFFAKNGWLEEKLSVYRYWLKGQNRALWLRKRAKIQELRVLKDKDLLKLTVSSISFGEKYGMDSKLLSHFANPLMTVYKSIVQALVFW